MNEAVWHVDSARSEIRPVFEPRTSGLLEVDSICSLISTGTERVVALGQVPRPAYAAMRVPYMDGDFSLPIKYGYSLIGTDSQGRLLHCMHPHQRRAYVRPGDVTVLPDDSRPRRMVLISNMETAVNAIWDADIAQDDAVAVCGFGGIGALVATTLRLMLDVPAVVIETDCWRRELAAGLDYVSLSGRESIDEFPVLIEASGTEAGLQWCIDHGAPEARIVVVGWHGDQCSTLRLGDRFHYNRLKLISSQVSVVSPRVREKITVADRKRLVIDLLTDGAYERLPNDEVAFAESPAFFDNLRNGREGNGLIWLIRY